MMSETTTESVNVEQYANDTVRLMTHIVGVTSTPEIITAEVSGSGKTMSAELETYGKTYRLDTAKIMAGESEYRDSSAIQLYTPERFQNIQHANHAPGPQTGCNEVSDTDELPEPTHTPIGEDTDGDDSDDDDDTDGDSEDVTEDEPEPADRSVSSPDGDRGERIMADGGDDVDMTDSDTHHDTDDFTELEAAKNNALRHWVGEENTECIAIPVESFRTDTEVGVLYDTAARYDTIRENADTVDWKAGLDPIEGNLNLARLSDGRTLAYVHLHAEDLTLHSVHITDYAADRSAIPRDRLANAVRTALSEDEPRGDGGENTGNVGELRDLFADTDSVEVYDPEDHSLFVYAHGRDTQEHVRDTLNSNGYAWTNPNYPEFPDGILAWDDGEPVDGDPSIFILETDSEREEREERTEPPLDVETDPSGSVIVHVPDLRDGFDTRPFHVNADGARRLADALDAAANDAEDAAEEREPRTDGGEVPPLSEYELTEDAYPYNTLRSLAADHGVNVGANPSKSELLDALREERDRREEQESGDESRGDGGEDGTPQTFPVENLRNRMDTVEVGDTLTVAYYSRRAGREITVEADVLDLKREAGAVWWVDIDDSERDRTIRVQDSGDVETVGCDGSTQTIGPVTEFARDGVQEPELVADGGVVREDGGRCRHCNQTRGHHGDCPNASPEDKRERVARSARARREQREEWVAKKQIAWEREKELTAAERLAAMHPGAVAVSGTTRMLDVSSEPGHVQRVTVDTGRDGTSHYHRVRVRYAAYGIMADVSEQIDDEPKSAGEFTTEDADGHAVLCHAEFIRDGDTREDRRERVAEYVAERWVPDLHERPRVAPGDSDE